MENGQLNLFDTRINEKWAVIVNPNSGSLRAERDWPVIKQLLYEQGFQFDSVVTSGKNHAIDLTRHMITNGYRKFISVGGDGLLNEVVNGILGQKDVPSTEISLGMIPVGTGNDWCRTAGIPLEYMGAIQIIKKEHSILHDAGVVGYWQNGQISTRYFINMAGIGFDAEVCVKINNKKSSAKGGKKSYLFELGSTLFSYRSTKMIFHHQDKDDKPEIFSGSVFSASAGIGKYNGGGMLQAPDAKVDDGLFHLTIIKKLSPFSVIFHIKKLFNGQIEKHPKVIINTAKNIKIQSEPPVRIEVDGEPLGYSPFEVRILEKQLKMLVGPMGS